MNANELIEVKQLHVIHEQFKNVKDEIKCKVDSVLSLECTEDTVKEIKILRSDLNKYFQEFEKRRKEVKEKISAPYEVFNNSYNTYIKEVFKEADNELKKRIDFVEETKKKKKKEKIESFFEEYKTSKGIDFITFKDTNINITLTASEKSLKENVKSFVDRVVQDLQLIETQEHKTEILVEYKETLNVSYSITTVLNRHKKIKAIEANEKDTIKDDDSKLQGEHKPLNPPVVKEEKIYQTSFTVRATMTKIRELSAFLKNDSGYQLLKNS